MTTKRLRDRIQKAMDDTTPVPNAEADDFAQKNGMTRAEAREVLRNRRKNRVAARLRTEGVRDAALESRKGGDLTPVFQTPYGRVCLARVVVEEAEPPVLNVWVGDVPAGSDSHFRITNPPTLVEDPSGDVEVNGRKYREDPLGAVAEVIAMHQKETRR